MDRLVIIMVNLDSSESSVVRQCLAGAHNQRFLVTSDSEPWTMEFGFHVTTSWRGHGRSTAIDCDGQAIRTTLDESLVQQSFVPHSIHVLLLGSALLYREQFKYGEERVIGNRRRRHLVKEGS